MATILSEANATLLLDGNLIRGKLTITDSVLEFCLTDGRKREMFIYDIVASTMRKGQTKVKALFLTKTVEYLAICSPAKTSGLYILKDNDADAIIKHFNNLRNKEIEKRQHEEEVARKTEEERLRAEAERQAEEERRRKEEFLRQQELARIEQEFRAEELARKTEEEKKRKEEAERARRARIYDVLVRDIKTKEMMAVIADETQAINAKESYLNGEISDQDFSYAINDIYRNVIAEKQRLQREAEEARRQEELRLQREAEEARRQEELRLQREVEEGRRQEELRLQREAEEARRQEELRLQREAEEARRQEELRLQREAEEARRQEELRLQREAEEARRQEELRLQREAEEAKRQEELRLQREAEEARRQEELRLQREAEEARRQEELRLQREAEEARRQEELRLQREAEEARHQEELRLQREAEEANHQEDIEFANSLDDLEFDIWMSDKDSQEQKSTCSFKIENKIINKRIIDRDCSYHNVLMYKSQEDYVYESSHDYAPRHYSMPYEYKSYYGESISDLIRDQKLEDALYVIDSYPWGEISRDICESLYIIDESYEEYIYKSLEDFAYNFLDYKYKITDREKMQAKCISEIEVFTLNGDDFFLAIEVNLSGNENHVRNELIEVASVFHQISSKASHFLFKIDSSIMFASFALVEQKSVSFDKINIAGKRKVLNIPTNYVNRCITSEFFNYYMSEEGWTTLKEIDVLNYVQTFARKIEVESLSAEYIIYELAPFKDSYKLNVEQLTSYCKEIVISIYGTEWFEIHEDNYVSEIREERLSEEDWDLLEFELESDDSSVEEFNEEFEDEFDEENDAFDDIPEDVLNDPVAMLKWLEEKEEETDGAKKTLEIVGMLSELIIAVDGKLPIDVQKTNWSIDYHFIVKEIKNGYAYGDAYVGDNWQKRASYPLFNSWHKYKFYDEK